MQPNSAGWFPRINFKTVVKQGWIRPNKKSVLLFDGIASQLGNLYGLEKYISTYHGPCIRVRRDVDGVEADIGFTSTGKLDEAALLAHVGPNNGYITVWYTQIGSDNAFNTVAAQQAMIVNAGTIIRAPNGKPIIRFNGSSYNFIRSGTNLLRNVAGGSILSVTTCNADSASYYIGLQGTNNGGIRLGITVTGNGVFISAIGKRLDADANVLATRANITGVFNRYIARGRYSEGQLDIAVNGAVTSAAFASSGNTSDTPANVSPRIGSAYGSSFHTGDMRFYAEGPTVVDIAVADALLAKTI